MDKSLVIKGTIWLVAGSTCELNFQPNFVLMLIPIPEPGGAPSTSPIPVFSFT